MAASPPSPPSPAPPSLLLHSEPSTPARQRSLPAHRPPGRSELAHPLLGFNFGRACRPLPCSCSSPHPLTCRVLGRHGTLILRRRLIAVLVRPCRSCPTHFPTGIKSLLLFIRMFLCELGGGEERNSSASHTLCLTKCLNQNLSSHPQFGLIMHYGMINGVTEEGHPIQLPPVADRTFHLLKQKLVQAPVLGLPNDFSKGFVLETAVFMQSKNLVAYLNKHLCPRNQASSRSVWQSLWQLLTNGGHTCSTVKS
ncbi:uncharacterized protein LOC100193977 [Zea mays]|uniref:Uncharacterized protein n=1 Tax=Zea mays TaxID=4577 RepID=B4FGZ2_MAIZE|nr:uncharacterized protein LOC100193977 [Zea mays]ACF81385.1 unknown [Zea mays]|eukprot:NP_001132517.1 uncharacterized protein LOC100193977 [Zea mays]